MVIFHKHKVILFENLFWYNNTSYRNTSAKYRQAFSILSYKNMLKWDDVSFNVFIHGQNARSCVTEVEILLWLSKPVGSEPERKRILGDSILYYIIIITINWIKSFHKKKKLYTDFCTVL